MSYPPEAVLPPRQRTEHGLTLIEVLVALAVIALGLLAVVAVAARSGKVDADLQQRTFGDWVAGNEITRLRLAPKWPDIGASDGKVTLAGRDWHWQATVEGTPDPDLRKVTVTVTPAGVPDDTVSRLLGFIGKPGAQATGVPAPGATTHAGAAPGG